MDEADEVGTGTYLIRNGHRDRCDIISDHLDKVSEICKKYDVFPMIWSDMYCRIGSKNYDHYDTESRLDQSVIDRIPDVEMVYWDYYHYDCDFYRKIIQNHKRIGKPLTFASGIWMWDGLLPNIEYTYRTMVPALQACRAENVESFMATMWGDTGNEANHFFSLFGVAMFAEYAFSKEEPTDEQVYGMLKTVTGMEYEPLKIIDGFFCGFDGTVKIGTRGRFKKRRYCGYRCRPRCKNQINIKDGDSYVRRKGISQRTKYRPKPKGRNNWNKLP